MSRQRNAKIKWTYPRKFESAINCEVCLNGWGIYYISRKFAGNETMLYIGLTFSQNFVHRIGKHNKNWLHKYRGEKYIRFGEFIKPLSITKDLVEDAESCLIYELDPVHNKCKKSGYTFTNEYKITSMGYRGVIPKVILTRDHCE
jgi:hypothetical protein